LAADVRALLDIEGYYTALLDAFEVFCRQKCKKIQSRPPDIYVAWPFLKNGRYTISYSGKGSSALGKRPFAQAKKRP
jgi:hypothetical protein